MVSISKTLRSCDVYFSGEAAARRDRSTLKRLGIITLHALRILTEMVLNTVTYGAYGSLKEIFSTRKLRKLEKKYADAKITVGRSRQKLDLNDEKLRLTEYNAARAEQRATEAEEKAQKSANETVEEQKRLIQDQKRLIEEQSLTISTLSEKLLSLGVDANELPVAPVSVFEEMFKQVGPIPLTYIPRKVSHNEGFNPENHDPDCIVGSFEKSFVEFPQDHEEYFPLRYDQAYVDRYKDCTNMNELLIKGCQFAYNTLVRRNNIQFNKSPAIWYSTEANLARLAIYRLMILDLIKGARLNQDACHSIRTLMFNSNAHLCVTNSNPQKVITQRETGAQKLKKPTFAVKFEHIDAWTPNENSRVSTIGVEPLNAKLLLHKIDRKKPIDCKEFDSAGIKHLEILLISPLLNDSDPTLLATKKWMVSDDENAKLVANAFYLIDNIAESVRSNFSQDLIDTLKSLSDSAKDDGTDDDLPLIKKDQGFTLSQTENGFEFNPSITILTLANAQEQLFIDAGIVQEKVAMTRSKLEPIWNNMSDTEVDSLFEKMTLEKLITLFKAKKDPKDENVWIGDREYPDGRFIKEKVLWIDTDLTGKKIIKGKLPPRLREAKPIIYQQYHMSHQMIDNHLADGRKYKHGCLFSALAVVLFQDAEILDDPIKADEMVKKIKSAMCNYLGTHAEDFKDLVMGLKAKTVEEYQLWLNSYEYEMLDVKTEDGGTYEFGSLEIKLASEAFETPVEFFAPNEEFYLTDDGRISSKTVWGEQFTKNEMGLDKPRLMIANEPGSTYYPVQLKLRKSQERDPPDLKNSLELYNTFWESRFHVPID